MSTQPPSPPPLSRRERQIMDAIYALGSASVSQVRDAMPDPPSYSSVRTLMGLLEDKGHLQHSQVGPKYVYRPTVPPEVAGKRALANLVHTFFGGSVEGVVSTLLQDEHLDPATLDQLSLLIEQAKEDS